MNVYECVLILQDIELLQKEVDELKYSTGDKKIFKEKENLLNQKKSEFAKNGCNEDLFLLDCARLDYKMTLVRAIIQNKNAHFDINTAQLYSAYLKGMQDQYDKKKCEPKMIEFKNKGLESSIAKYSSLDAQRINAQSQLAVKQRILIIGSLLITGVVMIIFVRKSKK